MAVFNASKNETKQTLFFGDKLGIARYDQLTHPQLEKIRQQQLGFFWRPEEINDIIKDKNDFWKLTAHEQHIFTSNLKRQILLDSVQGRAPSEAFTPICSLPESEIWMQTWAFSETIHSYSYTHIIRNVYPNPSKIFDEIMDIQEIVDCADDISKAYDNLIRYNKFVDLYGYENQSKDFNLYEHKRRLWLALMSVNILEGVRFYASFACSWAFAERKLMEGNAKIIKLICRDENLHLASTQYMLRSLVLEDSDFAKIAEETKDQCVKMFEDAVEQEKKWAEFLFKDGSMIGLTENILKQYVEYIARQRMQSVNLPSKYDVKQNPLPWTTKWISSKDVQDAPQEVAKSEYIIGGIKADVNTNSFKGFKL